jgi:hypothetical protein
MHYHVGLTSSKICNGRVREKGNTKGLEEDELQRWNLDQLVVVHRQLILSHNKLNGKCIGGCKVIKCEHFASSYSINML